MKRQYIIKCSNKTERKELYDYLIENGYKPVENFKNRDFINNHFPFVIEPNKTFWVCESVTCCAIASMRNIMITVNDYYEIIKNENPTLKRKIN